MAFWFYDLPPLQFQALWSWASSPGFAKFEYSPQLTLTLKIWGSWKMGSARPYLFDGGKRRSARSFGDVDALGSKFRWCYWFRFMASAMLLLWPTSFRRCRVRILAGEWNNSGYHLIAAAYSYVRWENGEYPSPSLRRWMANGEHNECTNMNELVLIEIKVELWMNGMK